MTDVPSVQDFQSNPTAATAAAADIAKATSADGDATTQALAWGIAAKVLEAAAPLAGSAIGGPAGALAGQAVATVAASLASQHQQALAALTADQQALLTATIAAGASAVSQRIDPTTVPTTFHN